VEVEESRFRGQQPGPPSPGHNHGPKAQREGGATTQESPTKDSGRTVEARTRVSGNEQPGGGRWWRSWALFPVSQPGGWWRRKKERREVAQWSGDDVDGDAELGGGALDEPSDVVVGAEPQLGAVGDPGREGLGN
jgi:hypothetical protein